LDQLFIIITGLTAVGIVLALLLRSGRAPAAPGEGSDAAAIVH
jgi:hypothetical protein